MEKMQAKESKTEAEEEPMLEEMGGNVPIVDEELLLGLDGEVVLKKTAGAAEVRDSAVVCGDWILYRYSIVAMTSHRLQHLLHPMKQRFFHVTIQNALQFECCDKKVGDNL
uniref:Uncharacterized protein n=1 Tax=Caenorhabditis japonica TaxID=281687 RepID=A0A8R1IR45_CAEJA